MVKLALVCSSGGHLFQLYSVKAFWEEKERFWVSYPTEDAQTLLKDEYVHWAYFPTNRSIKNLIKNAFLALKLLKKEQPTVIVTTGAGVAVPFIVIGKFLGIKSVYVESITRIEELSLTGHLIYPFVDELLVQWPELAGKYKKAQYQGRVI